MKHHIQLTRWLVLGSVVAVCVGAGLVIGNGKTRFNATGCVGAAVEAMDGEAGLAAFLKQPPGGRMDIAQMNLLAGSGLGRDGEVAVTNLFRELDVMTARVKAETARHLVRFQRAPGEFNSSEAYFRMLCRS
jgi:hypothetical protein